MRLYEVFYLLAQNLIYMRKLCLNLRMHWLYVVNWRESNFEDNSDQGESNVGGQSIELRTTTGTREGYYVSYSLITFD
jgi:hypothetical protein